MKLFLTCLLGALAFFSLSAQPLPSVGYVLDFNGPKPGNNDPVSKMPCSGGTLMFTNVEFETVANGDNNAANGAFMVWDAIGSSTGFYFNQIISADGSFTTGIRMGGNGPMANFTVFAGDPPNNTIDIDIFFGGNSPNNCIAAGSYFIRVWEVRDVNGNGLPDRVGGNDNNPNAEIIGCYIDSPVMSFAPSCPPDDPNRFSPVVVQPTCNNGGMGSIVLDFDTSDIYCVDDDGDGATIVWTGPNGFTSSAISIFGLEPGDYSVVITDFYDCPSTYSVTLQDAVAPVFTCPAEFDPPSAIGAGDGQAEIFISDGSGSYTITYSGPTTGSQQGFDGSNIITGLIGPGAYTITVRDNATGCEDVCVIEAPCAIDFEVTWDEVTGDVTVTILNGFPTYTLVYRGGAFTSDQTITGLTNAGIVLDGISFPPGDYEFDLTQDSDPVNCFFFFDLNIPPPDCSDLQIIENTITNPGCPGNDGVINVNIVGGESPDFFWIGPGVNAATTTNLTGLGPGTYTLRVSDARSCEIERTWVLTGQPALSLSCGAVDETLPFLDDGKIGYNFTGGLGPFSITYRRTNAGEPNVGPVVTTTSDTLRNLPAGDYLLQITDSRGCTVQCTATVDEPDCDLNPVCTAQNPVTATGTGSVDLVFDGTPDWTVTITGPQNTTFTTANANESITGLPVGDYNLTMFNSEGCVGSCSFSIVAPACALAFSSSATSPSCVGANNGMIALNITGAAPGLTIDWNIDAFDGMDTLRNLVAGVYTVTVADQTGCSVATQTITLTDPPALVVTLSEPTTIACRDDRTGTILASVSGGVGVLTYDWSVDSLPNLPQVTGLVAGTYSVLVTDANGCTGRDTIVIGQPAAFTMSCASTGETAAGAMDGTITISSSATTGTVSLTGDLGDFTITAATDTVFTNLGPGTYNVILTNANGCTDDCTAIISQGGCELLVGVVPTQPDCDNANGSATATATMANGVTTFSWSTGATGATVTNLVPGDYSVTATDELGCEALGNVTIDPFTDFPVLANLSIEPICDDGCAELSFTATGPGDFTLGYQAILLGGPLGTPLENSGPSGNRTLTICPTEFGLADFRDVQLQITTIRSEGNACSRTINDIYDLEVFPPAIGVLATTICREGFITVGMEVFDFGRPLGNVILPGASANGCDSTVTVSLSFFDASLGQLDTTVCVGGSITYVGEVFDVNRTTGDVVLPAADVNGCDSTVTVTLSFFPESVGVLDTMTCFGSSITYFGEVFDAGRLTDAVVLPGADVNGCDSTVTVTLSFFAESMTTLDTMTCPGGSIVYEGEVFDANRLTGEVILPGTGPNGCDNRVMVTLSFFPETSGVLDTMICVGGSITYEGETFDANRTTGEVILPGADVNGCDSTVIVTLSFFPETVGVLDTMTCSGGSITYEGETFDANRTTGEVILPGADVNGCDSTVTVTLSFFPESTGVLDTVTCIGGSVFFAGETFDANRTTGEVILPAADVNGCDSTVTVTLFFFPESSGVLDTVTCVGGSVFFAGETFDANRTTGDVILPGADVNGCDSTIAVTLSFFAPAFSALDTTICTGTSLNFFGEVFNDNRRNGDVIVPTPAANGCDSTVTVTLDFFPQEAGVIDTTICAGTVFTFGGRNFDAAVSGELVTLPTPSINGCDSVVAVTVRVLDRPLITLSGEGVVCADGELSFELTYDGPGTATVILSSAPQDLLSLVPGVNEFTRIVAPGTRVFIVGATGGIACDPITSGEINVVETDLTVELQVTSGDGIFGVSCSNSADGSILAVVNGGQPPFTYGWDNGSTGAENQRLATGTYTVTITSGRGCSVDNSLTLTAPEVLVASVGTLPATCLDSLPALVITDLQGGVGPYLLSTDPAGGFSPIIAFPDTVKVAPGLTLLQLEDANGCLLEEQFDLAGPPNSEITLTPARPVIAQGDSVEITINTELDLAGYLLTPGPEGLQSGNSFFVGPLETTTYLVFAADSAGCSASASVEVIIDDFVPVYAPTAFSPNEDGANDVFRIYAKPVVVAFSNFNIFDRWGNLVYVLDGPIDPQDQNWGWDGKNAAGKIHEPAVYVFSIDVLLMDGRTVTIKSDMVLMR